MAQRRPLSDIPLDVIEEWKFKTSLVKLLIFCALPFTVYYIIINVKSGDIVSGAIGAVFAVGFVVSLLLLYIDIGNKKRQFISIARAFFGVLFLFHFYAFGVLRNFGTMPQMIIYPLLAVMILGRGEGHAWSGLYALVVGGITIYRMVTGSVILEPVDLVVSTFFLFLLVTLDIVIFETVRQKGYKKLLEKQRELQASRDQYREINSRLQVEIENHRKTADDLHDQTERAEAANRAKSEFLANMSHELRTPLNHVIGFNELVYSGKAGQIGEAQKEYLGDALSSGRHLLSLINGVLDLAKIEAGKLTLEISEIDIEEFVDSAISVIRDQVTDSLLQINVSNTSGDRRFLGDKIKLKQVMRNLVSNAAEYSTKGGLISVGVTDGGEDGVRFCVSDTGIGVEKENLERIFLPFEQEDNSVRRIHNGTGIGLALSKQLVELHGGKIWAESEGRGKGCSFYFTIPQQEIADENRKTG